MLHIVALLKTLRMHLYFMICGVDVYFASWHGKSLIISSLQLCPFCSNCTHAQSSVMYLVLIVPGLITLTSVHFCLHSSLCHVDICSKL